MDIPDHIDALKDFKPRREASLSRLNTDIRTEATTIIGEDDNYSGYGALVSDIISGSDKFRDFDAFGTEGVFVLF